jgi:hypothetical protein
MAEPSKPSFRAADIALWRAWTDINTAYGRKAAEWPDAGAKQIELYGEM